MSDNVPFHIQMEIIEKVSDIKSLLQFRSVSKQWKSFIESSHFIKGYGPRHTQPHSHILSYKIGFASQPKFICLVDDDDDDNDDTFKVQEHQQESVVSALLKQCQFAEVVGMCHGLVCLFCFHKGSKKWMVVICNPCIRKWLGILVPKYHPPTKFERVFGFGVSPVIRDPTVVRILYQDKMPWHAEVFTLSSGVWNVIPSANLPRQSIEINQPPTQVVIDRFIYWGASEETFTHDGRSTDICMVVSFDLINKEFKVVDLPDTLTNELYGPVSVSKLRGSLVVYGSINADVADYCGVWVMEHDSSFKKLFTIDARVSKIVGFSRSGEPIFEIGKRDGICSTLNVYEPCSQQIKNLGIYGMDDSFFMGSYKESLLLLDHSDSHIY